MRRSTTAGLLAAVAVAAALTAGSVPAVAGTAEATQINLLTLRVASDPSQTANVAGDSQDNGAKIIQWPLSNASNERWEPESALDGYVRLKGQSSGKCLNVSGGGSADGTSVIQYTCGNAANELWKFVRAGIGYQVVAKSSDKCLNIRGGVAKGNELIQYTCVAGGAANDVWLPVWENPS